MVWWWTRARIMFPCWYRGTAVVAWPRVGAMGGDQREIKYQALGKRGEKGGKRENATGKVAAGPSKRRGTWIPTRRPCAADWLGLCARRRLIDLPVEIGYQWRCLVSDGPYRRSWTASKEKSRCQKQRTTRSKYESNVPGQTRVAVCWGMVEAVRNRWSHGVSLGHYWGV